MAIDQQKLENNKKMMDFLIRVLNESKGEKKNFSIYYTIYMMRYGTKILVKLREPATTDIRVEINRFSEQTTFMPDALVVELFTAKSKNVKRPMATFKFEYAPIYKA